jgi:hypothetical protein
MPRCAVALTRKLNELVQYVHHLPQSLLLSPDHKYEYERSSRTGNHKCHCQSILRGDVAGVEKVNLNLGKGGIDISTERSSMRQLCGSLPRPMHSCQ